MARLKPGSYCECGHGELSHPLRGPCTALLGHHNNRTNPLTKESCPCMKFKHDPKRKRSALPWVKALNP